MWKEGHELVISPSKWAYLTYMIYAVIILSILGLIIPNCDPAAMDKVILLGAAFLAFMFLLMLLKRSKIKKIHPIIISEKGVQTSPENIINWDLIDYVYVLHERNGLRRYDSMDYFFVTEYHDNNGDTKSISININDFDHVEGEIEKAVKYWSGRDIGNLTAKSRDEIVSDKEIPEEEKQRITEKYQKYIPMFEEEKKSEKKAFVTLSIPLSFLPMAMFVCNSEEGLINIDAIGWPIVFPILGLILLIFFIPCLLIHNIRTKFREKPDISQLSDSEFLDLLKMVHNKEYFDSKKTFIGFGIAIVICILLFCLFVFV